MRHVQSGASSADSPRVGRWLLLAGASAGLILYGSLFPFRLRTSVDLGLIDLIGTLAFRPTTRGDIVANLLLYMPLGLCLMLAWSGRRPRWSALVQALLVGTLLSLAVELLQVYLRARVSSLTDIALNALGTFCGASAAIAYGALGTSARIPAFRSIRPDPIALSAVLLWLSFRLAPFVPTIDWQKYKDAIKPLFIDPQLGGLEVLRYVTGWLVIGYAVRLLTRREYVLAALLALVGIVLFGRIVVVGKTLNLSEIAALVACVPLAALLVSLRDRRRATVLAALLIAAIVAQGLAPFDLLPYAQGFSWMPFRSSLTGGLELNYSALLEKAFWYFSLVWMLVRCGWSRAAAALGTAGLVATIEIIQMWLPGRSADLTDPLLVLAAGFLLAMSDDRSTLPPERHSTARSSSSTVMR